MAARTSMSVVDRVALVTQMLAPERPYGRVVQLAVQYGVSRQTLYYLTAAGEAALQQRLAPQFGATPAMTTLRITPVRLKRAVVVLEWVGVSERDTLLVLEELLDTTRSGGYVAKVHAEAETLAAARNRELRPALTGLLAGDELFVQEQPILGLVHPASLYLAELTLAAHRDGETWGCLLLEHPEAAGLIRDAGQGLALGAQLAALPCQVGDWMHPWLAARWVGAQLERRAYAALAQQYRRAAQFDHAHTPKRLEHHFRRYEAERAAAETAIATYDQWHLASAHLRELGTQFEWATGQVRDAAQVHAALQQVVAALTPLAHGTQAQALVSLLQHQATTLCAGLAPLQEALRSVAEAWGPTATHMVCRLWQALQDWAYPDWTPAQRRQLEQAITESLAWASAHLGARLTVLQHLVAAVLAQWPRTSSSIECLNSLLRPYLNGRKQVSQGFLELFRFFHNTHTFVRGKRAGQSPLELAGGPQITDPLAFLGLGAKS